MHIASWARPPTSKKEPHERHYTDILFFATGYATHFIWKDIFLERKRRELRATAAKLVEAATELKQREEDLRHRWQRMVTGMSQLKAEAFGDDPRTWSEADDAFLESWVNADR